MLSSSAPISAIASALPSSMGAMERVQSRFGEIHIDTRKTILFPQGLLGFPDKQRFALAQFPGEKMAQFTLLQSLDDAALSFITLPLPVENAIVGSDDIREACHDLQIPEENLGTLLIVSVHRRPGEVKLSVNARAPIFIDTEQRLGVQYVFQYDRYVVQHML